MAVGDTIVDYQYDFGGFIFGAGTSFITTKVDGLLSLPSSENNDTDKTLEHGAVPGMLRLSKRSMPIDLHVLGTAFGGVETNLRTARRAFQGPPLFNPREMKEFAFKRPGEVKQWMLARCERRDFSSTYELAKGHASGSILLVAHDPVIYSLAKKTATSTLAISATVGSTFTATNDGDHPDGVNFTFKIVGPARNPRLSRINGAVTTTFAIDTDIQASEYLLVDTALKTAKVYAVAGDGFLRDSFGSVRLDSKWWTLLPGANTLQYSRSSAALTGAASTVTVTWRDGWT